MLHETGECIIGDLTPWDNISEEEKSRMELEAVMEILGKLPDAERLIISALQKVTDISLRKFLQN